MWHIVAIRFLVHTHHLQGWLWMRVPQALSNHSCMELLGYTTLTISCVVISPSSLNVILANENNISTIQFAAITAEERTVINQWQAGYIVLLIISATLCAVLFLILFLCAPQMTNSMCTKKKVTYTTAIQSYAACAAI